MNLQHRENLSLVRNSETVVSTLLHTASLKPSNILGILIMIYSSRMFSVTKGHAVVFLANTLVQVFLFCSFVTVGPNFTIGTTNGIAKSAEDEMNYTTLKAFEPFNSTSPHEESWCPSATCNNSPLCQPCMKRFLFILATGRSGSTTLLSMLNHLPCVSELGTSIMPCLCSTETLTYSNIEHI